MSKLVDCICGEKFPIRGEGNIGDHSLVCPPVLEKKALKKSKQAVEKKKEMALFKSGNPPCMCQAKYEETRLAFNFAASELEIHQLSKAKIVFVDFPNFPTGEVWERKKFWRFLTKLNRPNTQFRLYLKGINKRWLLKSLDSLPLILQNFLDKITVYVVESDKAPVSRDDILMLKHISIESGNVVIPVRDGGEKYRDLGYHLEGKHITDCRAKERFGGKKQFKWSTYKIEISDDAIKYVKIASHNCSPKEIVVTGFKPDVSFVRYK